MFHTPQLAGISHFFSGRRIAKFGALAVLAQLIAGSIARGQATTSIRGTARPSPHACEACSTVKALMSARSARVK